MRLQSLRTKFAIANILPILLLMPLLSLYLLNTLEEFYTQKLLQQLAQQGLLIFDQVREDSALVEDSTAAQEFLTAVGHNTPARVLLLSKEGVILGSTRAVDADYIGAQYRAPAVETALRGSSVQGTGKGLMSEVAYVVMSVQYNGAIRGVLRLSYEVDDVRTQFNQLRWLVIGGTGVTALLGLVLGLGLAKTVTNPLRYLTWSVQELAAGNYTARVGTQRQDEIGILTRSFNQMATQLAAAAAKRQQQLAAIVHELARPLTGMSAAVETLLDDVDTDAELRHDLLAGVGEEIARLERLVGTLQQVQKQIFQPLQLRCMPTSLDRIIHSTIANFEPVAAQRGVTLAAKLPADLPTICIDEDRMIQVLTNLLDNALKFTPSGGTITVAAWVEADAIQVCVSDTGVGIAPEELPLIFQQFYRGAESRPPETRGMGLGLTICQQIITAHGGKIRAESTLGQGTSMIFTLPSLGKL
jgi:two-component system, OmpR family, sensor histidine kinase BaeS